MEGKTINRRPNLNLRGTRRRTSRFLGRAMEEGLGGLMGMDGDGNFGTRWAAEVEAEADAEAGVEAQPANQRDSSGPRIKTQARPRDQASTRWPRLPPRPRRRGPEDEPSRNKTLGPFPSCLGEGWILIANAQ